MSSNEVEWVKLGLKSKAELHEMSESELEHYEDVLYWARAAAMSMLAYVKKFGHLKLLKEPEHATIVEDFTEEE